MKNFSEVLPGICRANDLHQFLLISPETPTPHRLSLKMGKVSRYRQRRPGSKGEFIFRDLQITEDNILNYSP